MIVHVGANHYRKQQSVPFPWDEKACGKSISVNMGSVMEVLKVSYPDWTIAISLVSTNPKNVPSTKTHHDIEVMQNSASFECLVRVPETLAHKIPEILAHPDTLRFEPPLCIPSERGPFEGPSQKEGVTVHDATKRFEIETLLKADLPKARVAEIAGVSVRTVHRVRAETETRSAAAARTDSEVGTEEPPSPAQVRPPGSGPGRPSKTADYRELVASMLEAQPGLKTLEVLRRARLAGYDGGKTALYALVRELRPRAVRPICRFEGVAGEFTQHDFGQVRLRWRGNGQLAQVQFFCSRLKFSRFALVGLVDNQRTETLVRSMADHFEQMGGIPLLAVFDRPSTAALKSASMSSESRRKLRPSTREAKLARPCHGGRITKREFCRTRCKRRRRCCGVHPIQRSRAASLSAAACQPTKASQLSPCVATCRMALPNRPSNDR